MSIRIEQNFQVDQPSDQVWDFLVDPERVVDCLPGAKLIEVIDDRTFKGEIGVRLGPIGVSFVGTIHFDELDRDAGRVIMSGEGKDRRGTGAVRMRMESILSPSSDGGTAVAVSQEIELTGRLASFGRGSVMTSVADMMFGRFTGCVQEKLASA